MKSFKGLKPVLIDRLVNKDSIISPITHYYCSGSSLATNDHLAPYGRRVEHEHAEIAEVMFMSVCN